MSTRSNIIIITPENQAHQFYHHCDGYLSGVGEELRCFINDSENYEDLLKKLATPDEYGGCYEDEEKHDQSEPNELHGDIEFLYIIKNKKLYFMEIWRSKDYKKLKTYKELVDYICINKHEIDLTKEVTDKGYIYKDNTPEDYTTTKTEVKTMNYTEEKTRIENEIKRLQSELETLKKQENKENWKKSLVEKFKEFIESTDFAEVEAVEIKTKTKSPALSPSITYLYNEPTAKVETEPTAEEKTEKTEPTKEPTAEEINEPENKFKIGDYVYYRNCNVYGDIVEIKGGIISIKEKDGNIIYKVRPEWIYKTEKPAEKPENKIVIASVPKPNETPEEKPVKMKMSLDEFIDSLPEPAGK